MVEPTSKRTSSSETREQIAGQLGVNPGTSANLAGRDTGWTGGDRYDGLSR